MGTFRAVFFESCFDNTPSPFDEPSFEAFSLALRSAGHRRGPKDGLAFSPAVYRPGTTRALKNVEVVTAVGLDLEHVTPARMAEVRETLKTFEHVVYSTHSHTPEAPRFRAVIALTRELPAALYPSLWQAVAEMVGTDVCDPATKDASRLFYLPAAPEGATTELEYWPPVAGERFRLDPLEALGLTEMQYTEALARAAAPSLAAPAPALNIVDGLIEKKGALALKPRPSADDLKGRVLAGDSNNWRPNLERLFAGEPFADEGGRDLAAHGCVSTIAWVAPEADVEDIAQLFEPSVEAMWKANTSSSNPPPTMDSIRAKIRRALNERRERWYEERAFMDEAHAIASKPPAPADVVAGPGERKLAYSDPAIERIARDQRCAVPELKKRLIIHCHPSIYALGGEHGEYLDPISKDGAVASLERDLGPWVAARVVDFMKMKVSNNKPPTWRPKTFDELLRDYGTVARKVVMQMGLEKSWYDAGSHTFTESICRIRTDIKPVWHHQIDAWLKLFAGEKYEKLQDWLSTLHLLSKPTCALVCVGAPGSGKNLIADGISKLWGKDAKPISLFDFSGAWNELAKDCPLVASHENLPGQDASKAFRRVVADSSYTMKAKYRRDAVVRGAVRVLLSANEDLDLFGRQGEEFNEEAAVAMEKRILQLKVEAPAAAYLHSIGGRAATEAWVEGEQLAQHVRWLMLNRQVKHGTRFLVDGDSVGAAGQLITRSPNTSKVLEWVVSCIKDGGKRLGDVDLCRLARIGGGRASVATEALVAGWEIYGQRYSRLNPTEVGRALKAISDRKIRPGSDEPRRPWFWELKLKLVIDWAEDCGLATRAEIEAQVNRAVAVPPAPPSSTATSKQSGSVTSLSERVGAASR